MARVSRKNNLFIEREPRRDIQGLEVFNTAIYARLSVEDNGGSADSLEAQIQYIKQYIHERPHFKLCGIFADNGYSGVNYDRPQFHKMIQEVQAGKINCIILKDLSRLGRNYIETGTFLDKICPMLGLRVIAINDQFDSMSTNSNIDMSLAITNLANDLYAKDISRKICAVMQTKMENGEYIGNYAPYGYQKDPENKSRLIIDPETAAYVKQIFTMRAEGMSYESILRRLNEANIPSPGRYRFEQGIITNNNKKGEKLLWNKHVLKDMLCNIVYIGSMAQGRIRGSLYQGIPYHCMDEKEWVVCHNTHEPIISKELFDAVQEINQKAKSTYEKNLGKYSHLPKAVNPYGKVLVCADCGHAIKLTRSMSQKRDKAYFVFKCSGYIVHGARVCTSKAIRQAELDQAVLSTINAHLAIFMESQAVAAQLQKKDRSKSVAGRLQQEIQDISQRIKNREAIRTSLYMDLKEGLLTKDEYLFSKKIYTEEIEMLTKKREELVSKEKESGEVLCQYPQWTRLIQQYKDLSMINEEVVEAFIEKIILYDDKKIEITLKYMDEFKAAVEAFEKNRGGVA